MILNFSLAEYRVIDEGDLLQAVFKAVNKDKLRIHNCAALSNIFEITGNEWLLCLFSSRLVVENFK